MTSFGNAGRGWYRVHARFSATVVLLVLAVALLAALATPSGASAAFNPADWDCTYFPTGQYICSKQGSTDDNVCYRNPTTGYWECYDKTGTRRGGSAGELEDGLNSGGNPENGNPKITPSKNIATPATLDPISCLAVYEVLVPQSPTRPLTIRFEYGDGTYEQRIVAQGTGVAEYTWTHQFWPWQLHTWTQRATILETGAYSESTTTHL